MLGLNRLAKRRKTTAQNRVRRVLQSGLECLESRQLLAVDSVVFMDSFETGANSNDWVGKWNEDSQNDWFRSGQRASGGAVSAEVDGFASNATLTMSSSVDLSGYDSAELTFAWYIENGFDGGEYLAMDVSSDGGTSWQNDVRRLSGNIDAENTWHSETVDLTPNASANVLIRFRSLVSSSKEDANVDNVKIVGSIDNSEPVGLISHWAAENTAIDGEGSNDGTPVSGAGYSSGQIAQGFYFDGVNDRVLIADSPSLRLTESMTIEGWVRVDSFTSGDGMILFRGDDRGGLDPFLLRTRFDGTIQFQIQDASNNGASVSTPMPQSEFVYVAATLDDATGEMSLYLNGVRMAQKVTTVRPFGSLDPNSNPGVGIGNHGGYPTTPHNFPFHGVIDELKIHDVPLSDAEILANFNASKGSLQPSISINDASVIEGETSFAFLGAFVSAGSGGLSYPKEQVFGPDGNLYVTSGSNDSVLRYDAATGEFIDVFVPTSAGLDNPQGLLFGPDGNLYVTSRLTDEVFRFNGSTGAPIDTFVAAGSGGLVNPVGLAFGNDSNLYVSSRDTDQVLRYDGTTGAFIDVFVNAGSGGLDHPHGLVFGPDGNLYVTSPNRDTLEDGLVLRYNGSTGAFIDVFVTAGHETGGINDAIGLEFGPGGDLYVGRSGSDSVLRYDGSTGALIESAVSAGSGGLDFPIGLLFDAEGNLYVSSRNTDEVLRYGAASQAVFTVNLSSPSASPVSVAFTTTNATATSGSDYTAVSGTLVFEPGVTSRTIIVPTFDDSDIEGDETFTVSLSNAVGTTIADGTGIGTIVDNEFANVPPIANGGADQTVSDGDNSGDQVVTLNGSGSDSDGSIVSYAWTEGATVLGNTAGISPTLLVGTHTLTLTVTDNDGATASDTVVITVNPNQGPTANAGSDQNVFDADNSGSEVVTVVGSGNDSDGTIAAYQWSEGATTLGNTATISPTLTIGTHTLTLTVTDNGGATASDSVVVTVMEAPSDAVLFEDSFEVGSNNNDWNGKWVEDSQNDFFRSTQRSTAGVRSAEVDGRATNATLTTSAPIDTSAYASAELTFDWLIEKGFDSGEYLSLDVSTNGGASWTQNIRQLRGNVDAENTWHNETVDLSAYASSNLLIRFRSYVSSSREDANIDNVKIIGSNSGSSAMFAFPLTGSPSASEQSEPIPVEANLIGQEAFKNTSRSVLPAPIASQPVASIQSSAIQTRSQDAVDTALMSEDLLDAFNIDLLTEV